MSKLILKDKTEIEIENGSWLGCIITHADSYSAIGELAAKLTADNLSEIQIESRGRTAAFKHCKLSEPHFTITDNGTDLTVRIMIREMTADEIKSDIAESLVVTLTDEQAITVKELYDAFDPNGKAYAVGDRVVYNGVLYKCKQAHTSQADWLPGVAPSLWVALEVVPEEGEETPAGTIDDPIPVPDTVTTSGMEYEYGKYYSENGVTYICKRGGVADPESMYGQKETLYFAPSALIGQYFEVAEG